MSTAMVDYVSELTANMALLSIWSSCQVIGQTRQMSYPRISRSWRGGSIMGPSRWSTSWWWWWWWLIMAITAMVEDPHVATDGVVTCTLVFQRSPLQSMDQTVPPPLVPLVMLLAAPSRVTPTRGADVPLTFSRILPTGFVVSFVLSVSLCCSSLPASLA